MGELATELILIGSMSPGMALMCKGLYWTGGILVVILVITALAIIGKTNYKKDKHDD